MTTLDTRSTLQQAGQWWVGGASVQGAAHRRRGAPNQDAIGWLPRSGPASSFVAAVSDGHGAPAHFKSDVGAALAVSSACTVLEWFASEDPADAAVAGLPSDTVAAWRAEVARHAAGTEPAGDWIEPADDKMLAYGATLLALGVSGAATVAMQIGDGDLFLGFSDGTVRRPLPDDVGLVGEQTYSLCSADAVSRFRLAVLRPGDSGPAPDFAMLSTDGLGKSFADEAALLEVVRHYRQLMLGGNIQAVLQGLPQWLDTVSARGSGDDVTLCLAVRQLETAP